MLLFPPTIFLEFQSIYPRWLHHSLSADQIIPDLSLPKPQVSTWWETRDNSKKAPYSHMVNVSSWQKKKKQNSKRMVMRFPIVSPMKAKTTILARREAAEIICIEVFWGEKKLTLFYHKWIKSNSKLELQRIILFCFINTEYYILTFGRKV